MTGVEHDNIELAKKAYSNFAIRTTEVERRRPMFDLLDDDVVFKAAVPEDMPVYGGEFRGKQAYIDIITGDDSLIEDCTIEGPLEFFGRGDRVVILGAQSYIIKKNRAVVTNQEFAIVLDFRDGKITKVLNIEDASKWTEACLLEDRA